MKVTSPYELTSTEAELRSVGQLGPGVAKNCQQVVNKSKRSYKDPKNSLICLVNR